MKHIWRTVLLLTVALVALSQSQLRRAVAWTEIEIVRNAEQEVKQVSVERLAAVSRGDRTTYERYTTEDYVNVDSDGSLQTRATISATLSLAAQHPGPETYTDRKDMRFKLYGDTAVLTFTVIERDAYNSGQILANFLRTEHYVRRDGRWQVTLVQHTIIPVNRRTPAKVDPAIFDRYVGVYEKGPGNLDTITRRGDKLFDTFNGGEVELLPLNEKTFFSRDDFLQAIFVADSNGKVTHYILLFPDGQEAIAKKIK